jgi:uncharacterized cupredoxin-like copper-binding protein
MNLKHYFFLPALIVLGIALGSCASSQNSSSGTTYTRTGNGAWVQVNEDEYHIHMPPSFPAGIVTFHITNYGEHKHNFKISGNGIEQQLQYDVLPGTAEDLTVTLTPGTYHVICPIIGHADLGMRLDVTATQ